MSFTFFSIVMTFLRWKRFDICSNSVRTSLGSLLGGKWPPLISLETKPPAICFLKHFAHLLWKFLKCLKNKFYIHQLFQLNLQKVYEKSSYFSVFPSFTIVFGSATFSVFWLKVRTNKLPFYIPILFLTLVCFENLFSYFFRESFQYNFFYKVNCLCSNIFPLFCLYILYFLIFLIPYFILFCLMCCAATSIL